MLKTVFVVLFLTVMVPVVSFAGMESALLEAVGGNDISQVTKLLGGGADINEKGENGLTSLMKASSLGNLDMVKLLVEKGAKLNLSSDLGLSALDMAQAAGKEKIVEYLKGKGAKSLKDSAMEKAEEAVGDLMK